MATITAEQRRTAAAVKSTARRRPRTGQLVLKVLFWALVAFLFIYTLFPFYWAVLASIRPNAEISKVPTEYWPSSLTSEHWRYVFNNDDFLKALRNSVIVSFSTVIIALTFGSFA